MTKHPSTRQERRKLKLKKFKTNEEKRTEAKDRPSKVWRKLTKERLQEWETQHELQRAKDGEHLAV